MVEIALHMYQELDKDTGEFFQFMVDHELMDLESKPGKAAGGILHIFLIHMVHLLSLRTSIKPVPM